MGKWFNLDTDNTLGGEHASNLISPSQKAIKEYIDNAIENKAYRLLKLSLNTEETSSFVVSELYDDEVYEESFIEISTDTGASVEVDVMPRYKSRFVLLNNSSVQTVEFAFNMEDLTYDTLSCRSDVVTTYKSITVPVLTNSARVVELFQVDTFMNVLITDISMDNYDAANAPVAGRYLKSMQIIQENNTPLRTSELYGDEEYSETYLVAEISEDASVVQDVLPTTKSMITVVNTTEEEKTFSVDLSDVECTNISCNGDCALKDGVLEVPVYENGSRNIEIFNFGDTVVAYASPVHMETFEKEQAEQQEIVVSEEPIDGSGKFFKDFVVVEQPNGKFAISDLLAPSEYSEIFIGLSSSGDVEVTVDGLTSCKTTFAVLNTSNEYATFSFDISDIAHNGVSCREDCVATENLIAVSVMPLGARTVELYMCGDVLVADVFGAHLDLNGTAPLETTEPEEGPLKYFSTSVDGGGSGNSVSFASVCEEDCSVFNLGVSNNVNTTISVGSLPTYKTNLALVNTSNANSIGFAFNLTGLGNTAICCYGDYVENTSTVNVPVMPGNTRVVELCMVGGVIFAKVSWVGVETTTVSE